MNEQWARVSHLVMEKLDEVHHQLQGVEALVTQVEQQAEQAEMPRLRYEVRGIYTGISRAANHLVQAHVLLVTGEEREA